MTQSEVIARLQPIFDDFFGETVVLTPETTADDVEEWDSLAQLSLLSAIQHDFKIRFRVGEAENAKNIGELANLIGRYVSAK
jgi:acyl carrier protein